MPSSTLDRGSLDWGRRLAALWIGVLAGPVVWAALLETNYVLSYVACERRHTWMLFATTAAAVAVIALSAFGAWRAAPPAGEENAPSTDPIDTAVIRARFMVNGALALCGFFILVILATAIPAVVLHPCTW
jgi:quinol-cytochrome oxidoreductase complex cytochrome b subunit